MPGLSGSDTSTPGLSVCGVPSPGHSAPGSSESGPFPSGPNLVLLYSIDIEMVLNEFSQSHPHRL